MANDNGVNPADGVVDLSELDRALQEDTLYGNRPVEAFATSALKEGTFGLSNVIATAMGMDPERPDKVAEQNPGMALAGTAAGIVGPALASGGTSLAAKGLSSGVRAVTKAGVAAEKAAAAALAPRLGPAATTIASKAIGGAAEGALVGAGNLASDIALEKRELSGESALATVGLGALLGGGFGAAFGTAAATVPSIKALGKLGGKVKDVAAEGTASITDPVEGSLRLASATTARRLKLKDALGDNLESLPTYLQEDLGLDALTTAGMLLKRNQDVLKQSGEQIGAITKQLDEVISSGAIPVSRAEVYQPLLNRLNDVVTSLGSTKNASKAELRVLERYRKDVIEAGISEAPFSFDEFNKLRQFYQSKKYNPMGVALENFEANLAEGLRQDTRVIIDRLAKQAEEVDPLIAAGLKAANKKYHMASVLESHLEEAANRAPGFSTPVQYASDMSGRVARNIATTTDIAAKTAAVTKYIGESVNAFFTRSAKAAKFTNRVSRMTSTQALMSSGFGLDPETGKAPKNKQAAFDNLRDNVATFTTNPDALVELIAKRTARVAQADAGVAGAMQTTLAAAVAFLNTKLPKPAVQPGMFHRPYQPSSMEMAKFERYLQVIEKPLTALADLENGTLTREHVEALQAVYPEIYREIQVAAMAHVADTSKSVSYSRKVQLSILLDIPADSSMAPESVMQLQQSIAAPADDQAQQPAAGGGNAPIKPSGAVQDMKMAGRAETATERVASR